MRQDVMEGISVIRFLIFLFPILSYAGSQSDECYKELSAYLNESGLSKNIKSNPTFEQLANTQIPSDFDKNAIAKYADKSRTCSNLEIEEMPKDVHPGFPEIFKESENKKQDLLIDLYNQKISYGKFLRDRQADAEAANKKLSALRDEVERNNQLIETNRKAAKSRALADFFGGMSRAFAPAGSTNCSPNGTGGYTCYKQ